MLGLQIHAPRDREFKLHALAHRGFQVLDGVGVVHAVKRSVHELFHPLDAAIIDAVVEELHVVGTLVQKVSENRLQEPFGQVRVVGQVGKRNLWLDHPELGEVAGGVGVFRPERRAEGVDLGQRTGVRFHIQLT